MTVLLAGIRTESPLALVAEQLEALSVPTLIFHQRDFVDSHIDFNVEDGRVKGNIQIGNQRQRLEEIQGLYLRLMDDQELPEVKDQPRQSEAVLTCRAVHETLLRWAEIAPTRVVNRLAPMGSNFSKPYQAQLITRTGFDVPETLVTNNPDRAIQFIREKKKVIYKSVSGVRSIVKTVSREDEDRLDQIRWCPVQFQAFVEGTNVRVHTIGESVFATRIETTGTDYRYAHNDDDGETQLTALDLPESIAMRALALSKALGLVFAGIDLKFSPDGRVYCFEVNPCPAYSYYEAHTGQPIAEALARYLAGMNN